MTANGTERALSFSINPAEAADEVVNLFKSTPGLIVDSALEYNPCDPKILENLLSQCSSLSIRKGERTIIMVWKEDEGGSLTRVCIYPSLRKEGLDVDYTIQIPTVDGKKIVESARRVEGMEFVRIIKTGVNGKDSWKLCFSTPRIALFELSANGDINHRSWDGSFSTNTTFS